MTNIERIVGKREHGCSTAHSGRSAASDENGGKNDKWWHERAQRNQAAHVLIDTVTLDFCMFGFGRNLLGLFCLLQLLEPFTELDVIRGQGCCGFGDQYGVRNSL